MNFKDLNRILKSKIFLHKVGQLQATHVILKYTPTSTRFQSPIHIINAKDPQSTRIDIAVEGFLIVPPPKGTQTVELTAHQVANLI